MACPSTSGPDTSTRLLEEIRDLRSREHWRRFVDMYTPYLEGLLRRRGFAPADVADVVQETFVAVVDHIGDFRYDPTKRFRGWLATIALRKAARITRRQRQGRAAAGGSGNLGLVGDVARQAASPDDEERRLTELLGRLQAALTDLEWQVFELTVLNTTATAAAAAQLGISTGYLFVCRSRAKHTLLRLLEEGDA